MARKAIAVHSGRKKMCVGVRPLEGLATPEAELYECRLDLPTVLGQLVNLRRGRGREDAARHDAGRLEFLQAGGQDVRADARQALEQVGEAARPEQQLADHEQRPALADEVERPREAAELGVTPSGHCRQTASCSRGDEPLGWRWS